MPIESRHGITYSLREKDQLLIATPVGQVAVVYLGKTPGDLRRIDVAVDMPDGVKVKRSPRNARSPR